MWVGQTARAQTSSATPSTQPAPVTDGSAQASPAASAAAKSEPVVDAAADASPVTDQGAGRRHGIAPHTALKVRLTHEIDSGRLKNGQDVPATLSAPVQLAGGRFPAGTPVQLSVIATVQAGKLGAAGEFSLQLLRVGKMDIYTDTQTFHGKPGHKDLPDSAAQIGTNAGLPGGASLTFHVQPLPTAAGGPPAAGGATPGSITEHASGSQGTVQEKGTATGTPAGKAPPSVTPANTTSRPIQGSTPAQPR